jgi:serpin B
VLAAAALAAGLAGCASAGGPPAAPTVAVTRGVAAVEPAADPRPLGAADTGFGLGVLRDWCAQYPGRNLVFSPSTLASSLGLAFLGARGTTAAGMARVLDLPASAGAALTAGLQARSNGLGRLNGPGVTVSASNQVWADPTLTTAPGYLNAVATGYGAGVARVPFLSRPASAADQVNGTIAAQTRGHIKKLVTPDMLRGVGWVLTSALYLDARWAAPFDPAKTGPGPFTLASGKSASARYLHGDGFNYAKAAGWTAVSLPYQGGKLTMTALLPPAGAGDCALPGTARLAALTGALRGGGSGPGRTAPTVGTAEVELPKVSLDTSGPAGDMRPALTRLGMGQAFTDDADFTGLSPQAKALGFVQQAATLDVAEKGTVGAAAAATGISASAAPASPAVRIAFNRPYLMMVWAQTTGEPLFLAEVANPAAS